MLSIFNRLLAPAGMTVLTAAVAPGAALAGNFAHGGDWLKLQFQNGKRHAAAILTGIDWTKAPATPVNQAAFVFLREHSVRMAADLTNTGHLWTDDTTQPYCAMTDREPGATIRFALPACRQGNWSGEQVSMLLIHETIHHMGVADEEFADLAALVAMDLWRQAGRHWRPMSNRGVIAPRHKHTAVWTGREMLVFGGAGGAGQTPEEIGGRYRPDNDEWLTMSGAGAPAHRVSHSAVWTGQTMLVWGGTDLRSGETRADGGSYDPATDRWRPMAPPRLPQPRTRHSAVWTGDKMLLFGGRAEDGLIVNEVGLLYDPPADTWSVMPDVPAAWGRHSHSAVYTGENRDPALAGLVLIWGGKTVSPEAPRGLVYDTKSGAWRGMSKAGEPKGAVLSGVLWAENRLIVVGGGPAISVGYDIHGGIYDPKEDRWQPLSTTPLMPVLEHTAIWTGDSLVTWGGRFQATDLGNGIIHNRVTGSFSMVPIDGAPSPRAGHTSVWTGHEMIIWGGLCHNDGCERGIAGNGGVFVP